MNGISRSQFVVLAVGILAMLGLSNSFLYQLGWELGNPNAPLPMKIHPASYIITLVFGAMWFFRWRMVDLRQMRADLPPTLRIYIVTWMLIFAYVMVYMGGGSIGFMVDSLLIPFFTLALLLQCNDRQRATIFTLFIVFICINGFIGILEKSLNFRLIPLVIEGLTIKRETRATALMGHPLYNGLVTVVMALAVMGLKPPLPQQRTQLLIVFFFLLFASLAFGARAATLALIIFSAVYAISAFMQASARRQVDFGSLALAISLVTVVPIVFMSLLLFTDVGQTLSDRLEFDDSAMTRLQLFRIYEHVSLQQFLLGVGSEELDRLISFIGLPWTVENSWIMLQLRFGMIFFMVFLVGFISLLGFLWKNTNLAGKMVIGMMLINVSTNNMLAAKGHTLTVISVIAFVAPAWVRWQNVKIRGAYEAYRGHYAGAYGYPSQPYSAPRA